jgi:hypothetical protein
LLHTVLFHRALGVVKPKDTQLSLFDVVYVRQRPQTTAAALTRASAAASLQAQCDDPDVEAAVEGRVADFCDWAEKRPERRDATARRGGAQRAASGADARAARRAGHAVVLREAAEAGVVHHL